MKKRIFVKVVILIVWIALSIILWNTQMIWVIPVFFVGLTIYHCAKKHYRRHVYFSEIKENPFIYISVVVALVSTVVQFWQELVVTPYQFLTGPASIWVMGIFAALVLMALAVLLIKQHREEKADKKRVLVFKAQRDAEDVERQIRNEERKKIKEEGQQMLSSLMEKHAELSWKDLLEIIKKGADIPDEVVLSANLLDLIEVSNVKNQIFFKPNSIKEALLWISQIADKCHNDDYLTISKKQIKKIESLKSYTGYNCLVKTMETVDIPEYLLEKVSA